VLPQGAGGRGYRASIGVKYRTIMSTTAARMVGRMLSGIDWM
jgi:hypothetical protein